VARALGGVLETHAQFGTAALRLEPAGEAGTCAPWADRAWRVDFAMCRTETYRKPAAYPAVAPGTLRQDLGRRDFTINAIAVALAPSEFGRLVDPCGGALDLERRRLRILHARSFLDDPSRILRGVRLAQRFGLAWERATRHRMRAALAAGALGWLNAGRLRKELARMAQEPDPTACFAELAALLEEAARGGLREGAVGEAARGGREG
jgi:tRNA nucleotidyltransferase/poly(A) polymerase